MGNARPRGLVSMSIVVLDRGRTYTTSTSRLSEGAEMRAHTELNDAARAAAELHQPAGKGWSA